MLIEKRLEELGIVLPKLQQPIANFMMYVRSGNFLHLAGQGPLGKGMEKYQGKLPQKYSQKY